MSEISAEQFKQTAERAERHERLLLGESGKLGMAAMVQIMWRTYVWLLCALSGGGGSLVTYLIMRG